MQALLREEFSNGEVARTGRSETCVRNVMKAASTCEGVAPEGKKKKKKVGEETQDWPKYGHAPPT